MGGQETLIMNIYRNIDRKKIQFDFIVHSNGYYDEEIKKMGGKIYQTCRISKSPIKYLKELSKIIKNNNYQVIHRHTCSAVIILDLLVAKICKVSKVIVHSHNNNVIKDKILHLFLRKFINILADKKYACSTSAGEWLYGKSEYEIIPNGIEISKFIYNDKIRNKIKKQENVENKKIIGHIGRFEPQKNHEFILEVISEVKKYNKNIEFWLIGEGSLKNDIYIKAEKQELIKNIKFLGIKDNVNEYLQGMDMFIFPSKYEGLGIALIEAQIAGLDCIVSPNISDEAIITKKVRKEKLEKKIWAEYIIKKCNSKANREININDCLISNYDIKNITRKLTKYYLGEENEKYRRKIKFNSET